MVIHNVDRNEEVVSTFIPSLPYKFQPLPSYTSFNVDVFHENGKLFSEEIRTFDGVEYDSDYNCMTKKYLFLYIRIIA